MDWIVIEGVKPYDGRYEFDLESAALTTREWGWIKRLSGYMPLTLDDGFNGGDPELFSAFAVIALRRADVISNREVPELFDRLVDSPFETTIRLESDEEPEEDDAGPPALRSSENAPISGLSSTNVLGNSDDPPKATGTPDSVTSESPPMRSVS